MHDFDAVLGVLLAFELDEAVALVLVADFVAGDVHVDDGAALCEQLPDYVLGYFLVEVPDVDRGLLVALVDGGDYRHYGVGLL